MAFSLSHRRFLSSEQWARARRCQWCASIRCRLQVLICDFDITVSARVSGRGAPRACMDFAATEKTKIIAELVRGAPDSGAGMSGARSLSGDIPEWRHVL